MCCVRKQQIASVFLIKFLRCYHHSVNPHSVTEQYQSILLSISASVVFELLWTGTAN